MTRPASLRRQKGFTLLELVVAITLTGLVLVMLYSGLRIGLNSWESGEQRVEQINRLRVVHEFLRRQLTQSIAVYQPNEKQEKIVAFTGWLDGIEFVSPMLAHLGLGGLYRVRIMASDGRLWIRWRPYLPGDPNAGDEQESVLLEGVSGVEWAYFGPEQDRDAPPPNWRSEWANPGRRPQLVRLNLNLDGAPWPDLVVALSDGRQVSTVSVQGF